MTFNNPSCIIVINKKIKKQRGVLKMFKAKIKTDNGRLHMDQLQEVIEDFHKQWHMVIRELSKVDKAISDIHHFIEISPNLNAAEGYKAYKDLKELLERRRDIKDSRAQMQPFKTMLNRSNLSVNRLKQVSNNIQDVVDFNESERFYKTRVLKSEFGEVIK